MAAKKKMTAAEMAKQVDGLLILRDKARKAKAAYDKLNKEYTEAREAMLKEFTKSELEGMNGKKAQVYLSKTVVPVLDEPDKFRKYILRNKAFDMISLKPKSDACRERWDAGKRIPGVSQFQRVTLNVRERKDG